VARSKETVVDELIQNFLSVMVKNTTNTNGTSSPSAKLGNIFTCTFVCFVTSFLSCHNFSSAKFIFYG